MTVYHIAFIFHMVIGLSVGLTPIDFMFSMSRVKITRVTFVKKWFLLIFLRPIYIRAFKCDVLIALTVNKTPSISDSLGHGSRVKVTMVTFEYNMVSAHYSVNCLSHSFYISRA